MEKEFEALKTIKIKCHPNSNPSPLVDGALEIIEQALLELQAIKEAKPSDIDINKSLYNIENRRQYMYDDDIATLFYKGRKVKTTTCERFRYGTNDFLDEPIWDKLTWSEESKSYKYKDWEWIVLDLWR